MSKIDNTVSADKVVTIHYTLTSSEGEVLDRSGDEPLAYLHGQGNIVPGLEREMDGRSIGDKFNVIVPPEDAYGPRHENGEKTLARKAFPADAEIEPGEQFATQTSDGSVVGLTVVRVEGDSIIVDTNHPLAGETLTFDVEVVDVRDASAEEKSHGHVHGAGCQH